MKFITTAVCELIGLATHTVVSSEKVKYVTKENKNIVLLFYDYIILMLHAILRRGKKHT